MTFVILEGTSNVAEECARVGILSEEDVQFERLQWLKDQTLVSTRKNPYYFNDVLMVKEGGLAPLEKYR